MRVQVTQRQIESVCLNLGILRGNHDNLLSHVLRSNFFQRKKSKIGLIHALFWLLERAKINRERTKLLPIWGSK